MSKVISENKDSIKQNNIVKTIKYYKKLLLKNSNNELVLNNIAYAHFLIGDYINSEKYILQLIKINNKNPYTFYNLGNLYKRLCRLNEAIDNYNIAISLEPENNDFLYNKGYVLLKQKKYDIAWKYFENRIFTNNYSNTFDEKIKKYLLQYYELNTSQKICVVAEQGIGDQILFGSMFKNLNYLQSEINIILNERLIKIFERSFKKYKFISNKDFIKIDKQINNGFKFIYSGSLGRHFRTSLDDFDGKPFLVPDPNKVIKYKSLLSKYGFKKFVGISWKSYAKEVGTKSLDLKEFTPLLNDETIGFINLQYGDVQDIEKYNLNNKIIKIQNLDLYHDIDDVIALIDCLDLVITTPNVNVHFAGSVGKKCIVLSPLYNELFLYSALNDGKCEWYGSQHTIVVDDNINSAFQNIKKNLGSKNLNV